MVDQTGLKVGIGTTIVLLILAFILDSWVLVGLVAIAQFLGALTVPFAPYKLFYQTIIKPSGLVKPRVIQDNPKPHQFAMLVGAIFNTAGMMALITGVDVLGWVLIGIVVVLANLNFWLNFCLGCWMYYQLSRWGVPGFRATALEDHS